MSTPGWIVANITATADGMPQIANPAHPFDITDQTRPFEDRWGGWYVTGTSENMRHLGNVTAPDPEKPFELPAEGGRTLASLSGRFDPAHALKATSDIVALMTLEHQTGFIDRLDVLNAKYSDAGLDDLVTYMTFANEVPLPGPISGDSGFTADFAKRGPSDSKGRSLRTFDLKTRLFRYPLSYMVYSTAFDALKPEIKDKLYRRLYDALKAKGADGDDAIAILAATKPDLPDYLETTLLLTTAGRIMEETPLRIDIDESPDPALRDAILKPLRAFNESKIGPIKAEPLAIVLRDPQSGAIMGGLWGTSVAGLALCGPAGGAGRISGPGTGHRIAAKGRRDRQKARLYRDYGCTPAHSRRPAFMKSRASRLSALCRIIRPAMPPSIS